MQISPVTRKILWREIQYLYWFSELTLLHSSLSMDKLLFLKENKQCHTLYIILTVSAVSFHIWTPCNVIKGHKILAFVSVSHCEILVKASQFHKSCRELIFLRSAPVSPSWLKLVDAFTVHSHWALPIHSDTLKKSAQGARRLEVVALPHFGDFQYSNHRPTHPSLSPSIVTVETAWSNCMSSANLAQNVLVWHELMLFYPRKSTKTLCPSPPLCALLYLSTSSFMQLRDNKCRHNESRAACFFDWRLTCPFVSGQFSSILARPFAHPRSAGSTGLEERNGSSVQAEGGKKWRILFWQESIVRTAEINYKTAILLMCLRLRGGESEPHNRTAEASPLGESRLGFL